MGSKMSRYTLMPQEVLQVMAAMKSLKCTKAWCTLVTRFSVILIECEYSAELWKILWNTLCHHYDKDKLQLPDKVSELQKSFGEVIKNYQETNTKLVCELPRMSGYAPKIPEPEKYTPYYVAKEQKRVDGNLCMEDSLNEISVRISDVIKEGFNFLRVEASEIVAFEATDADRVVKPGIPPHIPIAYGLQGSSMSAEIMRNMINDLRDELVE